MKKHYETFRKIVHSVLIFSCISIITGAMLIISTNLFWKAFGIQLTFWGLIIFILTVFDINEIQKNKINLDNIWNNIINNYSVYISFLLVGLVLSLSSDDSVRGTGFGFLYYSIMLILFNTYIYQKSVEAI